MENLKVEKLVLGVARTNCYLLINNQTNEVIIVDPADQADLIQTKIMEMVLKPVAILLTHGHFDHIMAVDTLIKTYGISVYAGEKEEPLLLNPKVNLSARIGKDMVVIKADVFVHDNQIIHLCGIDIKVYHTPGHTTGSVCYYIEKESLLFTGDTLFNESVGRSDFPTGDGDILIKSIQEKLFILPDETKVYPGHEGLTTISHEKIYNPFVRSVL